MEIFHATSVVLGGKAILICGESGCGKSFLALRLIENHGAQLVADDITLLECEGDTVYAIAPDKIAGKIEVRGVGIVSMPYVSHVPVGCVIQLQNRKAERMPEQQTISLMGCEIPLFTFDSNFVYNDIQVINALRYLEQKDKKC